MKVPVVALCVVAVSILGVGEPAFAQNPAPRLGVTIGYETLRVATNPCSGCAWNWYQLGFNVGAAVPLAEPWQIVGEFGWSRHPFREDPSMHVGGLNAISAGAGLRWNVQNRSSYAPFAQIVAGLHRDSFNGGQGVGLLAFTGPGIPANSFMVQPGVGVVFPMNMAWGFVGQVDYRRVFADDAINAVRVVLGVRLNRN